jgi:hypothetical protein
LWLTTPMVVLMALASAMGILVDDVYAKESASWAAQGVGQDIVNLLIVCPALAAAAYLAARGSLRARLVWMGLLIYVVYSYVLYSFFVHFNALFLAYVAILGLSAYALAGASVNTLKQPALTAAFERSRHEKAASAYLMITGAGFTMLWLADIIRATAAGTTPANIAEMDMPVNPIHVLDLAFILPGMILVAVLLRRRSAVGLVFAVPLMTFGAAMGAALVSMSRVMTARGIPGLGAMELAPAVMVALGLSLAFWFMKHIDDVIA